MCINQDDGTTATSTKATTTSNSKATTTTTTTTTTTSSKTKKTIDMDMLSPRELKIQKLNDRVSKLTKDAIDAAAAAAAATATAASASGGVSGASSKSDGTTTNTELLPPHIVRAQESMTILYSGSPIYQLRSSSMVYIYSLLSFTLMTVGIVQLHPLISFVSMVTIFLGYDFYSGILHVVFDHPQNIYLPLLGQPCLEFQWHHLIPDDLVRKEFVDVCGDLNVVIGILSIVNLLLLDIHSPIAVLMGGMKLFMAYYGQFSHRSAHTHSNNSNKKTVSTNDTSYLDYLPDVSDIASTLQQYGFMISRKDHAIHHKEPYELDFCLIGICNPIIDFMRNYITTNNTIWLVVFLIWSIFDLMVYVTIMESLLLGLFNVKY